MLETADVLAEYSGDRGGVKAGLALLHRRHVVSRAKASPSPFDFVAAPHTTSGMIRRAPQLRSLADLPSPIDPVSKVLFPSNEYDSLPPDEVGVDRGAGVC